MDIKGKGNQNFSKKGKIFAMAEQEGDQNRNVLAGNILISYLLAYVLIDSITTHSFIFFKFVHKLGIMVESAHFP